MQLSPFHKLLKEETSTYHDDLEKELLPIKIFNLTISKEEYIKYLELFFEIHNGVEKELLKFNKWSELNFDIESYFRKNLILKDLEILDTEINNKNLDIKIHNFPEALGFLYVLTGSTMGGIILSKKVEEIFKNAPYKNANNYFNAFGEKNHTMFFVLMKLIEEYSRDSEIYQKGIIRGAINCYLLVKNSFQNIQ